MFPPCRQSNHQDPIINMAPAKDSTKAVSVSAIDKETIISVGRVRLEEIAKSPKGNNVSIKAQYRQDSTEDASTHRILAKKHQSSKSPKLHHEEHQLSSTLSSKIQVTKLSRNKVSTSCRTDISENSVELRHGEVKTYIIIDNQNKDVDSGISHQIRFARISRNSFINRNSTQITPDHAKSRSNTLDYDNSIQ
ncbi:unnamed protein product [Rotaria magnacalcarata]|uniref:Uncharacterized protein n=1 Tax=Rotaria magnacalcarata TaxID=392030 RepID=A0A815WVA5_9BILA|nr:unnamed protein product [Rotaria magnacalcarata]